MNSELGEQLVERADAAGVAVGEPVGGVEEDDAQAHRLGQVGQLGADVAVADDAEGAAAHLVAALGRLVPDAGVHLVGLLGQPASQRDDLGDHQLDHAAGVGVRRVEGRHAPAGGGVEVDLVGPDAEGADGLQVGRGEHALGDLGVRPDADHRDALQRLDQLLLAQGAGAGVHADTVALEDVGRRGVDVLEQEDFGSLGHRPSLRGVLAHRSVASTMR